MNLSLPTAEQVFLLILKIFLLLIIVFLFFLSFYFAFLVFRLRNRKKKALNGSLLLVALPQWREKADVPHPQIEYIKRKVNVAEQMYGQIYGCLKRYFEEVLEIQEAISFEIVATASEIKFFVFTPHEIQSLVIEAILATHPEAEINIVPDYKIFTKEGRVAFTSIINTGPPYAPIKTYQDLISDPLNGITTAMSNLKEDEAMVLQVVISPTGKWWRSKGQKFLNYLQRKLFVPGKNPFLDLLSGQFLGRAKMKEPEEYLVDENMFEGVTRKLGKPGFETAIRVVSVAKTRQRAEQNLDGLVSAFSQFSYPPINELIASPYPKFSKVFIDDFLHRYLPLFNLSFWHEKMVLNLEELATIFHFPGEEIETPKIAWVKAKKAPAPTGMPKEGVYMGDNLYRGSRRKIFMRRDDRRRHLYIVGQTGVGKSEFLKFMAIQDIKKGEGVGFIDPHGDVVEDLLEKIPEERMADVIYFNPADVERPLGLNILEAETDKQKHMAINSFINLLYKMYDPNRIGIMGPILERAIRNTMLTAMEEKGNTLVEVLRLLTSPKFAASKIPLIKDPLVKTYWTEQLAQTSSFHKSETLAYFTSKFDRFVTEKLMRNIIGQSESSFNFREVMDQRKILLVNLSKGLIGEENSNFLGLILVPRLLIASMSRVDISEEERADFYLYVDEFQNFATPDFAEVLSEARKYRLNLIVANQFIAQIKGEIREAVFGNVGSLAAFRVGVDDAEYLKEQFAPVFSEYDLINNEVGNMYVRLLINGRPSRPFSLSVSWKDIMRISRSPKTAEKIINLSRFRFGKDKDLVEAEIIKRAQLGG